MVGGVVFEVEGVGIRIGDEDDIAGGVILVGGDIAARIGAALFAVVEVVADGAAVEQAAGNIETLAAGVVVGVILVSTLVAQCIAAFEYMVGGGVAVAGNDCMILFC